MVLFTFDAHNHIHLGQSKLPWSALETKVPSIASIIDQSSNNNDCNNHPQANHSRLCGLAIMSTHPRDYPIILEMSRSLPLTCSSSTWSAIVPNNQQTTNPIHLNVVPCFGVHPWFLHELDQDQWKPWSPTSHLEDEDNEGLASQSSYPHVWIHELEHWIQTTPNAIVGEIGMDGFHFDCNTGDLTTPMEVQMVAFEAQLELAARYQRPVSIHAVQCFGQLMESLSKVKQKANKKKQQKNTNTRTFGGLPPKIYFHAFGGKVGTVDQLISLCKPSKVYFGFAPIVNARSPKTPSVICRVGLERIVLESDLEEAAHVPESMEAGIDLIAQALKVPRDVVVQCTTRNALELYGFL